MLQDWSTATTLAWSPPTGGNYMIGLWARSAGATADLPQTTAQLSYRVMGVPAVPMTSATLSASQTNTSVGATVTFTAAGSGGAAPYAFKLWVQKDGGAWTLLRDWSTSTTANWTPAAPGTYAIGLWARNAGSTADLPDTVATRMVTVTP